MSAAKNATRRIYAGRATYPGDVERIVGELHGPTTRGTFLVAEFADYDWQVDRTLVEFATITDQDKRDAVLADNGASIVLPDMYYRADAVTRG